MRWLFIVFTVLLIAVALLVWRSTRLWQSTSDAFIASLRQAAKATVAATYLEAELNGLPEPVARFFRAVLRDGQPIIRRARILWTGEFNMGKPGQDNWKPFTAVQEFVPAAPGFVWDARIAQAPILTVFVRDGFVAGSGMMQGAIIGLFTVVEAHGKPTLNEGALQRYLGEAVWFPTALLPSQGVRWEAIDDTRARATITVGTTSASLEMSFDAAGMPVSAFTAARFYDDGKNPPQPLPWLARNLSFTEFNGVKVPAESVVEWQFPDRTFAYWRGRPLRIDYD